MAKRILVGVDFSTASRQALARARSWAEVAQAPLIAVHVLHPPAPMLPEAQIALPDPAWLKELEDHARAQLEGWIADIPGASVQVVWGSPAEELVKQADADCLLVVAQRGHSALERLIFGSTAAKVVKHAPCDVLVVRAEG
jgi:universal stress protein A